MQLSQTKLNADTIERDLEVLFRRWFESELSNGSVTLVLESRQDQHESGKIISIIPARKGCAEISAFCENGNDIVYLTVGQNTILEVPLGGERYTTLKNAEELTALVKAVAGGKFEETIWTRDSKIIKSIGRIFIDDGAPITVKTSTLTKPFVALSMSEHKYLPFGQ